MRPFTDAKACSLSAVTWSVGPPYEMKIFMVCPNSIVNSLEAGAGQLLLPSALHRLANKSRKSLCNPAMALSRRQVAFIDSDGAEHSIEVDAESFYEAVALGIAEFRAGEIGIDVVGQRGEGAGGLSSECRPAWKWRWPHNSRRREIIAASRKLLK